MQLLNNFIPIADKPYYRELMENHIKGVRTELLAELALENMGKYTVSKAVTTLKYPVRNGSASTEPSITRRRPDAAAAALKRRVSSTAAGEWSTAPTSARIRPRIRRTALPPPQPTSRTRESAPMPAAARPHRCRGVCHRFMDLSVSERHTTLDGVERTLDAEDLLITDSGAERVLGIAGVMGGADTEITEATVDVLVEAAHFDPV